VALDGSQPLWLGCWFLAKAKAGKSPIKGSFSLVHLFSIAVKAGDIC
jgi:hypothetical protein